MTTTSSFISTFMRLAFVLASVLRTSVVFIAPS